MRIERVGGRVRERRKEGGDTRTKEKVLNCEREGGYGRETLCKGGRLTNELSNENKRTNKRTLPREFTCTVHCTGSVRTTT